jgi:hypothetical protein
MRDATRRDYVLDQAVAAGKFSAARRAHWQAQYDRDPFGTEQTLAVLASGLASGGASAVPGFNSPHTASLFPDLARARQPRRGRAAARVAATSPVRATQRQTATPSAEEATELTPEVVAAWSRQLFPDTASFGIRPGRVTRANN